MKIIFQAWNFVQLAYQDFLGGLGGLGVLAVQKTVSL
jgi:hypothetical protein